MGLWFVIMGVIRTEKWMRSIHGLVVCAARRTLHLGGGLVGWLKRESSSVNVCTRDQEREQAAGERLPIARVGLAKTDRVDTGTFANSAGASGNRERDCAWIN